MVKTIDELQKNNSTTNNTKVNPVQLHQYEGNKLRIQMLISIPTKLQGFQSHDSHKLDNAYFILECKSHFILYQT